MHKSAFSLLLLFVLAAGCGGGDNVRGQNTTGKLTKTDADRLLSLNRLQQDNIDAREYSHGGVTITAINEKSKAMGEKISTPTCVMTGDIPVNDLNGQIHQETLAGTGCPIYWFRRRGWTLATKVMVVADTLEIKNEDYRKQFSPMAVRSMEGSYAVLPDAGGFRVFGTVKFTAFQTTDYGRIEGGITVSHRNTNDEGAGNVIINLQGNRWVSSGSIDWALRRSAPVNVTYRINNAKVEEAQFRELFSSYELDKYMDNALKMK